MALLDPKTLPNQPVYCETLQAGSMVNTYLSEPINSYSNGFIFLAAFVCFYLVWRAKQVGVKQKISLYVACVFLLLNALGSWLWHSTKDTGWLPLDVFPAFVFLWIIAYFWFKALFSSGKQAVLGVLSLFIIPALYIAVMVAVLGLRDHPMLPIGFTLVMLFLFGFYLVKTKQKLPAYFTKAILVIVAMVVAAFFRAIDIPVCGTVPFGTHFLWHLGLSVAAVLGLRFALGLPSVQKSQQAKQG